MPDLVIELHSSLTVDQTVESIVTVAAEQGWKNPATHDLREVLLKFGKEVRPVKVIEICKPEYSGKILELNHERSISVLMPCRISVYQKDDGQTFVGLMNISIMTGMLPPAVVGTMNAAAEEMLEVVKKALALKGISY